MVIVAQAATIPPSSSVVNGFVEMLIFCEPGRDVVSKLDKGRRRGGEKGAARERGQYRPVTASTGEQKRPV
jgi:hypothetical protein